MSFLPDNYTVPSTSNYMKLEDGDNKFYILSPVVLGYQYWNLDGKPVRMKEAPKTMPEDIRAEDDGKKVIKHFWAFAVWNLATKRVELLEITQKSIMGALQNLAQNEEWGNPIEQYAITIKRSGKGFDTEYNVTPSPKAPLPAEAGAAWEQTQANGFDITRLFVGGDPFSGAAPEVVVDEDAQG